MLFLLVGVLNVQANISWKYNFGGAGNDFFYSVDQSEAGGYVAVGSSLSFGSGDWTGVSGKGGADAVIVKFQE